MRKFFTLAFWDYAGERALKTAVQALFGAGAIGGALFDLDVAQIASIAGGTVLASLATSLMFYKGDGTDNPNDVSVGV
ncbi:MAG TPA: holin [Sideroxyarcus sp.]|nr:holin [Sideroxyarcus sp.]